MGETRASRIAGTWYPADPAELDALIERSIGAAPKATLPGSLVALVSPHAGIIYSGRIAAAGYRLLEGERFDGVLVLGPCHRGGDGLAVIASGGIETPFGRVEIDEELARALVEADPAVLASVEPHRDEHSVEIQFPFLQRFLPGVPVTPVLMGYQTPETIEAAVRAIERAVSAVGRRVLLVASSDLSHYEPRSVASELDARVVECLERFDTQALAELLATNPYHACGGGPMVAVLTVARAFGADASCILAYGDSGDVNGDVTGVVGYVSAALYRGA